ncbi:MAG: 16S rRNA (adenine(1518)-N(6)/adenine(1519)-N(6))-dimethyltransferase RsmA [Trueperaceae bacterium]|nr:16S rRNA (adenine(1518)-N(6)/adenine(1519)-N(6))-dimethyltransferase RsmA [Trueperaceae bacterium]
MKLTNPSAVKALLTQHGLRPDRDFGQNFLVDASALNAIVEAAGIQPEDFVLEIGPGLGTLTQRLAQAARTVVSVELDQRLEPVLAQTLAGSSNVSVVFQDALDFDFGSVPDGALLVANLPYNVATPLVARALESGRFRRLVFLVQREVAERMAASPSTPQYGALSLLVRHFGNARALRHVAPGSFYPAPEVTSSVVRIDVDPGKSRAPELFALIRHAFTHRRKTLKRNLIMAGYAEGRVGEALASSGLDPRVRAEALDLATFERLSERLHMAGFSSK